MDATSVVERPDSHGIQWSNDVCKRLPQKHNCSINFHLKECNNFSFLLSLHHHEALEAHTKLCFHSFLFFIHYFHTFAFVINILLTYNGSKCVHIYNNTTPVPPQYVSSLIPSVRGCCVELFLFFDESFYGFYVFFYSQKKREKNMLLLLSSIYVLSLL